MVILQSILRAVIILLCVVSVIVQMVGLVGTYLEYYRMVVSYAVLCVIMAVLYTWLSIWAYKGQGNWAFVVVYVLLSIRAYLFSKNIKNSGSLRILAPL